MDFLQIPSLRHSRDFSATISRDFGATISHDFSATISHNFGATICCNFGNYGLCIWRRKGSKQCAVDLLVLSGLVAISYCLAIPAHNYKTEICGDHVTVFVQHHTIFITIRMIIRIIT